MNKRRLQSIDDRCKWRGKRFNDREWIYGFLIDYNGEYHILQKGKSLIDLPVNPWNLVCYPTVGQYTGHKDKNDKEIYEGDIVTDSFEEIGIVKWNGFNFLIEYDSNWVSDFYDVDFDDLEIIGNIHDNPELLNKEHN